MIPCAGAPSDVKASGAGADKGGGESLVAVRVTGKQRSQGVQKLPSGRESHRPFCPWDPPGKNTGVSDSMDRKLQEAKSGGRCRHLGCQSVVELPAAGAGIAALMEVKRYLSQKLSLMVQTQLKVMYDLLLILQFSCSVVSDSLPPHGLQHTRLPCASSTPGACSNSCPSSW